jgi:hypothetical protein
MHMKCTQYIVVYGRFRRAPWKKTPLGRRSEKGVYKRGPRSYNAAPFPDGVWGEEGARQRHFDSLGLSPAPITDEYLGYFRVYRLPILEKLANFVVMIARIDISPGSCVPVEPGGAQHLDARRAVQLNQSDRRTKGAGPCGVC